MSFRIFLLLFVVIEKYYQYKQVTFGMSFVSVMNNKKLDGRCCMYSNYYICYRNICILKLILNHGAVQLEKSIGIIRDFWRGDENFVLNVDNADQSTVISFTGINDQGFARNIFVETLTIGTLSYAKWVGGGLTSGKNAAISYYTYSTCSDSRVGPNCVECTATTGQSCNLVTGVISCAISRMKMPDCSLNEENIDITCSIQGTLIINRMGFSSCRCNDGWYGTTCNVELCSFQNCINGQCLIIPSRNMVECVCFEGYYGSKCQFAECTAFSCINGGTCTVNNDFIICNCLIGYYGPRCQHTQCYNKCSNNGKCVQHGDNFGCECFPDYKGTDCSILICKESTCIKGTCLNLATTPLEPICICDYGYGGERCDIAVCSSDYCNNRGICSIFNNAPLCRCSEGYSGKYCQNVDCPYGCSHGDCVSLNPNLAKTCQCKTGWLGNACNKRICLGNCVNGKCETINGEIICICSTGYKGLDCADIYCPNGFCKNGGTCITQNNKHICLCSTDYDGKFCQDFKICLHGGSLVKKKCVCDLGWDGDKCQLIKCYDGYCKNGATCSLFESSRICSCKDGFKGALCEFADI